MNRKKALSAIEALETIFADHKDKFAELGVAVRLRNWRCGANSATVELGVLDVVAPEDGTAVEPAAMVFKAHAKDLGLRPEWLGQVFMAENGKVYRIIGANLKARRFPVLARSLGNDKRYGFSVEAVRQGIENQEEPG